MDMFNLTANPGQAAYLWLAAAGLLAGAEMLTGSFYLLALVAGAVIAALTAYLGVPLSWQVLWAALGSLCGLVLVHAWRKRLNRRVAQHEDLDLGQRVVVTGWDADGCAQVRYRGTEWQARQVQGTDTAKAVPVCGTYEIAGRDGNVLLLQAVPIAPTTSTTSTTGAPTH